MENKQATFSRPAIIRMAGRGTGGSVRMCASGPAALDEARIETHVADVVPVQQPGQEALQPKAVSSVWT